MRGKNKNKEQVSEYRTVMNKILIKFNPLNHPLKCER